MSNDPRDSDQLSHGASPRRTSEGAQPKAGSKPKFTVKPPSSGPSGGAGDSGANKG